MIKLLKYIKVQEWLYIFISIIFIVAQVWLDLKIPDFMTEITIQLQTPGSEVIEILKIGGKMLLCAFGSIISAITVGYFAAKVAASFSKRLREELFRKVESFSLEEINKFSTSSLITRSTNDITQVQIIIAMGMQVLIKAPILATWAIIKIANKNWQWTLTTGIAVAILLTVIMIIFILAMPRFRKIQVLTDNLNRVTRENLTGIRVVRAYNAEEYEQEKFEKANEELTQTNLFVSRVMAIMNPVMTTLMSGMNLAIFWIGAFLLDKANFMEKITIFGDMVVFSSYAVQIIMSFMILTMIFIMLPRASVSAKRINEVLDTIPSIRDLTKTLQEPSSIGEVEFRNVCFKYPDAEEYVIRDVSFHVSKGQTVAFIGSTGSGKSTLINLIPRFYDATEGEVLIDGINVKDYPQQVLHNKIGYVAQKAVLFSGTVQSNVTFGESDRKEDSSDDIKDALKIAQSLQFVEKMDGGLDAPISQGGTNLSGGQKQRIAIARAIYRNPEIYIFDDSFSALDYKTDKILRQALKERASEKTKLIVASRIGTIKDADKIIVLEQGNVVGIGTHSELMKNCQVYLEIAYSQLSKEELENELASR